MFSIVLFMCFFFMHTDLCFADVEAISKRIITPMEAQCKSTRPLLQAPPPRVACVLDNRCATCHSDLSQRFGGLDLGRWLVLPNGAVTFPHVAPDGTQLDQRETFEILLFRSRTTDSDLHMPLGYELDPAEKEQLIEWFDERTQLSDAGHQ
ncbi:MAG: hypothetical protein HYV97_18180 [Bdellovibrio sp.]|nr:hypothetical protein [Bdellovibrio sp.]